MSVEIPTLSRALSQIPSEQLELGRAQNMIVSTIANSSYASYWPRIVGAFYNFAAAQIFTVSFYYDFATNTIKCSVNKKLISSDYIDNREVDAELQKPLRDCEFKVVDWIKVIMVGFSIQNNL